MMVVMMSRISVVSPVSIMTPVRAVVGIPIVRRIMVVAISEAKPEGDYWRRHDDWSRGVYGRFTHSRRR
jgi:hypothetical protein